MTIKASLPVGVALAATTSVALAQQSGAPHLASPPFLGRISGGAAVRYELTRTPGPQTVTIRGRTATVKLTQKSRHEYTAIVRGTGFRAGRTYVVVINAFARNGKTKLVFRKTLFLHRSLNRPPGG